MLELLPLILFGVVFLLILLGFPVAFTLGGVSILFGLGFIGPSFFNFIPSRIMGTMTNTVLIAVPLFVYMGIMLEKSGLAERMLDTMGLLFGRIKGGLAISVIIVGALLAASTGIVGATVITMGLISLPTMLKRGYQPELATGTIAASGTLGQIIPPSVLLVLMGSVLNVDVGNLFTAAFLPGLCLVGSYLIYVVIISMLKPQHAPALPQEEVSAFWQQENKAILTQLAFAFFLPLGLIVVVLGSILAGIASPTEAAAIGAFGATLLTWGQNRRHGKKSWPIFQEVMQETTKITSMVFFIIIGSGIFTLAFKLLGGETYILGLIEQAELSPESFLFVVMLVVFVAGFFIDFIEIIYIIVPIIVPVFVRFYQQGAEIFEFAPSKTIALTWIGILIAVNLQTSFLTPPFGFSLFYLKGVAPPSVTTQHLYRGIIPFILIQLIFLSILIWQPAFITLLIDSPG
ncbi:MAG: TRAP transporter large permease subunit [Bacteroidota bacterium]